MEKIDNEDFLNERNIEEIEKEDADFLAGFGDSKIVEEVDNGVPILTQKQIEKRVDEIIRFLKLIHPQTTLEGWIDECVEIRPIKRDPNDKEYYHSWNTFSLRERDREELIKYMQEMNGVGACMYYSTFAFNKDFAAEQPEGQRKYIKGKINNQNALFTSVLVADFDNIQEEEYLQYKNIFTKLEIETIDIFSGHGYQMLILLNKKCLDKQILRKWTELLISRGFDVDDEIKDPARVMRLPNTFNCKSLSPKDKYHNTGTVVATQVVAETQERYSLVDVFKRIQSLPVVIEENNPQTDIDLKGIETEPLIRPKKENKEKVDIKEANRIEVTNLKRDYFMLRFDELQEPLQKMLNGGQQGLRNQTMLFLIPFFRNTLGLDIDTIRQAMTIWGSKCRPTLDSAFIVKEVNRVYFKKVWF